MFFRELNNVLIPRHCVSSCFTPLPIEDQIRNLIKRWGIGEEEIGTRLSLAITFPTDVVRHQWFYDEKGNPYHKLVVPVPVKEVKRSHKKKIVKKKK
jgi:hypothetical protein